MRTKKLYEDAEKIANAFDEANKGIVARTPFEQRLTLEQRLAGLTLEQVLRVYTPEQRLAGLTEAEMVLALPDAVLRGLLPDYLATLPEDTRASIEKRIGKLPRRSPARPRKAR